MNGERCGAVREVLPDFVRSRLGAENDASVERHLADCQECSAERDLVQMIFVSRAQAPRTLARRIVSAVGSDPRPLGHPWWGISAAAVAALAIGIGIESEMDASASVDVPGFAYEAGEGDLWLSDDGFLAGAPTLDGLSEEALLQLLDELAVGSTEGSA